MSKILTFRCSPKLVKEICRVESELIQSVKNIKRLSREVCQKCWFIDHTQHISTESHFCFVLFLARKPINWFPLLVWQVIVVLKCRISFWRETMGQPYKIICSEKDKICLNYLHYLIWKNIISIKGVMRHQQLKTNDVFICWAFPLYRIDFKIFILSLRFSH